MIPNLWPEAPPDLPYSGHGWMELENKRVLSSFLDDETKTIVEIGTWLGLSARFMCTCASNATVYAIDHWNGLPLVEWKGFGLPEAEWKKLAPDPWAQFVRDSWDYRDRIVPVRGDSWDGIDRLREQGIEPDLVYIDGGHGYERVLGDILRIGDAWPKTQIVGDDWTWPGVRQAVEEYFLTKNIRVDGNCWWIENP